MDSAGQDKGSSALVSEGWTGNNETSIHSLARPNASPNVPSLLACRSKFENYTAVTLGLEGEAGDKVSARLWDAVDGHLKKEVGPGVDCLLTRVKSRCVVVGPTRGMRGSVDSCLALYMIAGCQGKGGTRKKRAVQMSLLVTMV